MKREKAAARGPAVRTSLSDMMSNLKAAGRKEMPVVVKGDVQGSVEAITAAVEKLGNDEVMARVIHGGVGGVTELDVTLAEASKAVILGFNVRAHKEARELAEQAGIEIRYYNIIYNLVDDVKAALSGMLSPTLRETMLGNAQILEIFHISKVGNVAGCRVTDGVVQRGAHVRLIRDNVVVHEGKLSTLKRFKDEVGAGPGRPGMRHGVRELSGHARRRRHRVLQRRGNPPHAVRACGREGRNMRANVTRAAEGFDRRSFTVAEILRMQDAGIISEDENFELIEGEIVPMQAKTHVHELIKSALTLGDRSRACRTICGLGVETTIYLSPNTFVEPDLVVYPKGLKLEAVKGADILLAIEVAADEPRLRPRPQGAALRPPRRQRTLGCRRRAQDDLRPQRP